MVELDKVVTVFATRLRELLKERNWSVQKFAKEINIPRTTINSWLNKVKSPKINYVCEIADFFAVTTDYLLGRED